jgi:hypothetical protein
MVNVSFYGGGIGAQLLSGNDGGLSGLLDDALVDLLGAFLAKGAKSPTQIAEIRNRALIKARETSIQQAGSQFAVKFAVGPTFDVLERISMRLGPWSLPQSRRLCRKFCHFRLPACARAWGVGKRSKNIQAETLVQSSKASNAAG